MKTNVLSKVWGSLRSVNQSARSVVSSDAALSEPMKETNKITRAFTMVVITVLLTVVFVYLATLILSAEGYLAGLVADVLAGYCVASGQCDLRVTLPAFAIAVIILTDLVIYLLASVMMFADQPEDEVIDTITEEIATFTAGIERRFDDLATVLQDIKDGHKNE